MQITDGGTDSTIIFIPGPASRYQWEASGPNPCPRCQELDGEIRTLEAWESSIMPGLHKHCRCKLICVEAIRLGWTSTDQLGHIAGFFNLDGSISGEPGQPGPQHLSKKNHEEAEGTEDIAPYVPPPYHYDPPPPPPPYVPPPYHYDH